MAENIPWPNDKIKPLVMGQGEQNTFQHAEQALKTCCEKGTKTKKEKYKGNEKKKRRAAKRYVSSLNGPTSTALKKIENWHGKQIGVRHTGFFHC